MDDGELAGAAKQLLAMGPISEVWNGGRRICQPDCGRSYSQSAACMHSTAKACTTRHNQEHLHMQGRAATFFGGLLRGDVLRLSPMVRPLPPSRGTLPHCARKSLVSHVQRFADRFADLNILSVCCLELDIEFCTGVYVAIAQ